jgi:biopolymer transport protein ExbD
MKINRKKKSGFLETCAASDLAFLLIIYFLVIAGFNVNVGFLVNLPARDSTRLIASEDLLRFELDAAGNIVHAEDILNIAQARTTMYAARMANPDIAVILTIDSQARWQNVVSFVELAQDLQIEAFSFSMRREVDL